MRRNNIEGAFRAIPNVLKFETIGWDRCNSSLPMSENKLASFAHQNPTGMGERKVRTKQIR
jgi:hypothetical protein